MTENNSNANKVNPFIEIPDAYLYPDEYIAPLNPYTNKGYIIAPYYYVTTYGRYFSIATGKFEEKQLRVTPNGYLEISVITNQGQKHLAAHRGVMSTFNPRPDMYDLQVDHIYGDKQDNRLSQLRWVTSKQNNQYAIDYKITTPRSRIITDEYISLIIHYAKDGRTDREISDFLENRIYITPETIYQIRTGHGIYGDILKNLNLEPVIKQKHVYLYDEDYKLMVDLYKSGLSIKQIAEKMNLGISTVNHALVRVIGNKEQRKDRDSIEYIPGQIANPNNKPRKKNPIVMVPQKLIDNNIDIYPVNIYASNLHVLEPIYGASKDGRLFSMAKGNEWKELRLWLNERGYLSVGLLTNHGIKNFRVHRIILATFNPRSDMYDLEIDHINGNKSDNRVENLEWVTQEENKRRAVELGLTVHKSQRAPDEDIIEINKLAWAGYSDEEISKMMDNKYSPRNVKVIRSGEKTYKTVLDELGLKPFTYIRQPLSENERQEIYDYIEARKDKVSMMELYMEAGDKFNTPSSTIRTIYGKERAKRK